MDELCPKCQAYTVHCAACGERFCPECEELDHVHPEWEEE